MKDTFSFVFGALMNLFDYEFYIFVLVLLAVLFLIRIVFDLLDISK